VLAKEFWPGPLTLVLGFAPEQARPEWLAGREEVAIRLPGHQLLREVAIAAGPILVTSANGHGDGAKDLADEAAASLHGPVEVIVDGGRLTAVPSTIVNTRVSPPRVEREGAIAAERIAELLGRETVATR
jgi:L-threonylcarbamoyladenylate synthase